MNKFLIALLFSSFTVLAQQTDVVDFLNIEASIGANNIENKIEGRFLATFKVLKETDSIYMDAVNIQINDIQTKNFKISSDEKKLWFVGNFEKGKNYKADIYYEMFPKQTLYFFENQIWTQGQGKYTSHWLPSIDDVNDKIEFDISLIAPENKTVIANGNLTDIEKDSNGHTWHFNMKNPMPSYLAAFAIGDFGKKELTSNSGIPI